VDITTKLKRPIPFEELSPQHVTKFFGSQGNVSSHLLHPIRVITIIILCHPDFMQFGADNMASCFPMTTFAFIVTVVIFHPPFVLLTNLIKYWSEADVEAESLKDCEDHHIQALQREWKSTGIVANAMSIKMRAVEAQNTTYT